MESTVASSTRSKSLCAMLIVIVTVLLLPLVQLPPRIGMSEWPAVLPAAAAAAHHLHAAVENAEDDEGLVAPDSSHVLPDVGRAASSIIRTLTSQFQQQQQWQQRQMQADQPPASLPPLVRVGVLLPRQDGDSDIPQRLAQEWIAAMRIALEVLRPRYIHAFIVAPDLEFCSCYEESGKEAAETLLKKGQGLVAVIGPHCSQALLGAAPVLNERGIPVLSFAATAEIFGDSSLFPNVFRTSFSDQWQAQAILDTVRAFNFSSMDVLHTPGVYGLGLATRIKEYAAGVSFRTKVIALPPTMDPDELKTYLLEMREADRRLMEGRKGRAVVLLMTPFMAEWTLEQANDLGMLKYPWWFVGSDGVVAFDLVGQGEDFSTANLRDNLQGELGVAPYKGDFSPSSPYRPFLNLWKTKIHANYPGLLTLDVQPRLREPREYVANLIDAFWTLYEAFDKILTKQKKAAVTAELVTACLRSKRCIWFKGVTGQVYFNATTGERGGTPQYDIVNLNGFTWREKARWEQNSKLVINFKKIVRPGPIPAGESSIISGAKPVNSFEEAAMDAPQVVNASFSDIDGDAAANLSPSAPSPPEAPDESALIPDRQFSPSPLAPPALQEKEDSSSSGLSGGLISLIVILSCIGVVGIGFGAYFLYKRRMRHPEHMQFVRML